ncbi:Protein of unknown function [Actinomadura madurae]|uniref:DUF2637 domain-containing protein n=1 Tax=Actinomadura madurae TaxID=1993 RepID=A0A1I5SU61_9ACTN|nr:DUF2637 domain-containing protein [Actinomadura madurae]SFP74151.1 Protein of unknown function [Actinomadura madurae]
MPSDSSRPSYTPAQRRLLTAAAGLVVAALAGGAFALTYDTLRELALAGRVSRRWAPLYPAMADTLTVMTILSLVVTRNARWWTRLLRWTLLIVLVAGGAAISVQRSVRGFAELPDDALRAGVAVAPHVMLVIAVWLWLTMFKQIRVARPPAEEAAPAETQRGHVKVLEPAPPPLALAAPAGEGAESDPSLVFLDEPAPEPGPAPEPEPEPEHEPEPILPFQAEEPARETVDDGTHQPEEEFEPVAYEESLSSEPAPPLDPLPEPRAPLDPAPASLPTDVELVRSRDRAGEEEAPVASTTRPDIVMPAPYGPGGDEDDHDGPPADRAEDPDADDANPPPSSNFRSGPTPPVD